jgi:hypothetical protein
VQAARQSFLRKGKDDKSYSCPQLEASPGAQCASVVYYCDLESDRSLHTCVLLFIVHLVPVRVLPVTCEDVSYLLQKMYY